MDFIQSFVPTSKAHLIQVAMWYNRGDVQKAQEFVDFYTKNMNLPDFNPVQPTLMQQMKGSVSELYSWIKENQADLVQGYQFIQSIVRNKGVMPDIGAAAPVGEPLPDING